MSLVFENVMKLVVICICRIFLFKQFLEKIKIFCIGGSNMQVIFLTFPILQGSFLAVLASSAASERLFSAAGKIHDDLKKNTSKATLEDMLTVAKNFPDA